MNESPRNRTSETALKRQVVILFRELRRLFDVVTNCLFSLTQRGTRRRLRMLIGLFLLSGFFIGLLSRELSDWQNHLRDVLVYLLNSNVTFDANPVDAFGQFIWETYKNPVVLHYLPVFILPFILAWEAAASYLADIFELEDVGVARTFIIQVAITGGSDKIRIREGEIDPESEKSPVFQIGGPGSVIVELDSVALFERADGRPQVIGPTVDGPVVLEGFERFRQAINIRDHRTDALQVSSRSLDGIPVSTEDVSFLFSVFRRGQPPSIQRPYPYAGNAIIETLVYNLGAKVTENGPRPADISKSWTGTMTGMIKNGLASFMSERNLTEYLASPGDPETLTANDQINTVINAAQRVLPPEGPLPSLGSQQTSPSFTPRPDIRDQLFGEFASSFPNNAAQKGIELHWVGIGSWKTPNEIVPGQHLEAWQLSMENQARRDRNPTEAYVARFIQDVPLAKFAENRQRDHQDAMHNILAGYREQYMKILNLMEKKNETRNFDGIRRIVRALRHINRILGVPDNFPAHWVRGGTRRPSPEPDGTPVGGPSLSGTDSQHESNPDTQGGYNQEEHALYNVLLQRVPNVETADKLIEDERTLVPNASKIELIQRAIERLERDNQ